MANSKQGSRLSRTLEQQSKKQLYIFLISSFLLVIVLIITGPRLLDLIGTYMIGDGSDTDSENKESIEFVAPPSFTSLPKASDTGIITISGSTLSGNSSVEIFVNNRKEATIKVAKDNTFKAEKITLKEGQNTIKGKTVIGDRESEFTKDYVVIYSKEPPKIEEVSPGDGTEFKRGDQEIRVQGKTDPNNTVTVNDFKAVVDESGIFSYYLRLNEGDNKIVIKAVDSAGKETTKELTVRFSP